MTVKELIDALSQHSHPDADVFVELSGDGDFARVVKVCKSTVTTYESSHNVALSIGWGFAHTPSEAWDNPDKWDTN